MIIKRTENSDGILQAVKDNEGYCPCKLLKSKDTKCMCKEFRECDEGICQCGLYIKIQDQI